MATAAFAQMSNEFMRLGSFSGFQAPPGIWPTQLASQGFCRDATCNPFEIVCHACGLKLDVRNIPPHQPVPEVHQRLAPNCSIVAGRSNNRPASTAGWATNQSVFNQDVHSAGQFSMPHFGSTSVQTPSFSSLPPVSEPLRLPSFSSLPQSSQPLELPAFSSLPQTSQPGDLSFDEGMYLESVAAESLFPIVTGLDELGQTVSSDALEPSVLPSLPSDFLDNFQNAYLTSTQLPDVLMEGDMPGTVQLDQVNSSSLQAGPSSADQGMLSAGLPSFGTALGGPGEVLVADGEALEAEGSYPPVVAPPAEAQTYSKPAPPCPPPVEGGKRTVTFDDLGIVVQRPKRQDHATVPNRLATFRPDWKKEGQFQTKEIMAEAGFYYAGYSDCCRCFYCGGGLKNWEKEDHPWIEHARWFKTCPYVITSKGHDFIEAVQALSNKKVKISMEDVKEEMMKLKGPEMTVLNEGRSRPREDSLCLSSAELPSTELPTDFAKTSLYQQEEERLESENDTMKQQMVCKICWDKEVSILFVPCGHLVTCSTCAPSMGNCPVCRQVVKGQVRVVSDISANDDLVVG